MSRRLAVWGAAVVPGALLVYLLLAGVFGLIEVNRDFRSSTVAEGGVAIYVRTNGVHADIVLPTQVHGHDWSNAFPPSQMRSLAEPAAWIAFGWGDRAFMLETPTWRDFRLGTALKALAGVGPGAMHVEYVAQPYDFDVSELLISREQHVRLVAAIRRSFRRGADGSPIRIDAPGYFVTDAFYEAIPTYSLRFTCNEWVRSVLSDSGLPAPAWAPFERTLFWYLPKRAARRVNSRLLARRDVTSRLVRPFTKEVLFHLRHQVLANGPAHRFAKVVWR